MCVKPKTNCFSYLLQLSKPGCGPASECVISDKEKIDKCSSDPALTRRDKHAYTDLGCIVYLVHLGYESACKLTHQYLTHLLLTVHRNSVHESVCSVCVRHVLCKWQTMCCKNLG